MNVYEALMRDGRKKRGEGEFAVAHEFALDCDCRDCATTQRDRLSVALFQMQEAAKDLAQREQKLLSDLAALLPGTHYMDPPDGGSVTLLEQLQRMARDAERYRGRHKDTMAAYHVGQRAIYTAGRSAEREQMIADGWRQTRYVAPVTDCEACLTPDACAIRGQCAHYLRERDGA